MTMDFEDINKPPQIKVERFKGRPKTMRQLGDVTRRQFPKVMRRVYIRAVIADILLNPISIILVAITVLGTIAYLAS